MSIITREQVIAWMAKWRENILDQNYADAKALFSADCVGFGTVANRTDNIDVLVTEQWQRVWGRTRNFEFDVAGASVISGADMAVAIVEWTSWGLDSAHGDAPFERRGRATMVLRADAGTLLCHHTHFSVLPMPERFLG